MSGGARTQARAHAAALAATHGLGAVLTSGER